MADEVSQSLARLDDDPRWPANAILSTSLQSKLTLSPFSFLKRPKRLKQARTLSSSRDSVKEEEFNTRYVLKLVPKPAAFHNHDVVAKVLVSVSNS